VALVGRYAGWAGGPFATFWSYRNWYRPRLGRRNSSTIKHYSGKLKPFYPGGITGSIPVAPTIARQLRQAA